VVYEFSADPNAEYRPVLNFPNYAVGSDGTVWTAHGGWIKQMKVNSFNKKYNGCNLVCGSRRRRVCIHTLVLEAFVGQRPKGMSCRHLDGNGFNNRLDNLKWGTPLEQSGDQKRHGTNLIGSRQNKSKLSEVDIAAIKKMLIGNVPTKEIAFYFGVSSNTITRIASNKTWKHVKTAPVPLKDRAGQKGSDHYAAKISEDIAREIFARSRAGESGRSLAMEFDVSSQLVSNIIRGKAWKHATRQLQISA
jgi:transcriptional regulator with XRE-family HTH domain